MTNETDMRIVRQCVELVSTITDNKGRTWRKRKDVSSGEILSVSTVATATRGMEAQLDAVDALVAHAAQYPGEESSVEDLLRLLLPALPPELHGWVRPEYRRFLLGGAVADEDRLPHHEPLPDDC